MQQFIHTVDKATKDTLEAEGYKLVFTKIDEDVTVWTFLDESGAFCFSKYKDNVKSKCFITDELKLVF